MENQNQETNQNEEQQDTSGNSQQQQATQDDGVPAWQRLLFESNQRAQRDAEERARMEAELNQLRQQQATNNQPTPLPSDAILNDPNLLVQRINQDVAAQVRPLNEFTREMQRQHQYRIVVSQMARDPGQIGAIINQLRSVLDDYFLSTPTAQPTVAEITRQAKLIIADFALAGGFNNAQANQGANNQNQNQNQNQNRQVNQGQSNVSPAHLRPSGRPSNQPQSTQITHNFDENERRLMREQGLTEGEYLLMRDTPPSQAEAAWKKIQEGRKNNQRI